MPRNEVFDREQVIDDAMNLFWKKGFSATSMQDLVDATGLGRSSIYNSFGSKMDFYKIALDRYKKKSAEGFRKCSMGSSNSLESIERIFKMNLMQALNDKDGKGCFIVNCKTEMANCDIVINQWLTMDEKQSLEMFAGLVGEGQEKKSINTRSTAMEYAYFLYNTLQGLRVTAITVKDKMVLDKILSNSLSVLR